MYAQTRANTAAEKMMMFAYSIAKKVSDLTISPVPSVALLVASAVAAAAC